MWELNLTDPSSFFLTILQERNILALVWRLFSQESREFTFSFFHGLLENLIFKTTSHSKRQLIREP